MSVTAQYLSTAMATRCNIDAVQQRTSILVQTSHSSGPRDHPEFICNKQKSLLLDFCNIIFHIHYMSYGYETLYNLYVRNVSF